MRIPIFCNPYNVSVVSNAFIRYDIIAGNARCRPIDILLNTIEKYDLSFICSHTNTLFLLIFGRHFFVSFVLFVQVLLIYFSQFAYSHSWRCLSFLSGSDARTSPLISCICRVLSLPVSKVCSHVSASGFHSNNSNSEERRVRQLKLQLQSYWLLSLLSQLYMSASMGHVLIISIN